MAMELQCEPTHKRLWLGTVRRVWPIARQVLGWLLIGLGLVGLVLPFLQGILFLVLGIALVGRRNWLIRRAALLIKRSLRRWAKHPAPLIGGPGRAALRAQHYFSRQSRHLHRRFAEHRLLRGDPAATHREVD